MRLLIPLLLLAGCAGTPAGVVAFAAACESYLFASDEAAIRWERLTAEQRNIVTVADERVASLCRPGYPASPATVALVSAYTGRLIAIASD